MQQKLDFSRFNAKLFQWRPIESSTVLIDLKQNARVCGAIERVLKRAS